jgi:hypothetical protein
VLIMAEAGAGRGLIVPPTAAEMKRMQEREDRNVFTEEKIGKVKTPKGEKLPRDLMPGDLPSPKKMAAGGYTRAADGCCKKGKTRGKMV